MKQTNTQKGVLIFVGILVVALLITIIPKFLSNDESSDEPPENHTGTLVDSRYEEVPAGVNTSDPSTVGAEALRIAYTVDPTTVSSMNQAITNARGLISVAYQAELRNNHKESAAFDYWSEHGIAWVVSSVEEMPYDPDLDSPTKAYRTYKIVQTRDPQSTSNIEQVDQITTVHTILTKYGDKGWKVDRIWQ